MKHARCDVRIRNCRAEDLGLLEWNGQFRHDRQLIRHTFRRTQQRRMLMLVAEIEPLIVGQVWIDLARRPNATYLWALRVRARWRGLGIASELLAAAERASARHGFTATEIDVEPSNAFARVLYERHGYLVIGRAPRTRLLRLRKQLAAGAGVSTR